MFVDTRRFTDRDIPGMMMGKNSGYLPARHFGQSLADRHLHEHEFVP